MRPFILDTRRIRPWLRAALVLYLLSSALLVAVHQHHGALQSRDCALCAVAHTPVVVGSAPPPPVEELTRGDFLPLADDQGWDSESGRAPRSRAPPQI